MDGNYEISSMPFSLKTMCLVKVAQCVLEHCGIKYRRYMTLEDIKETAMIKLEDLQLPRSLSAEVDSLISPIKMELDKWYNAFHMYGDPIFTPQGTINTAGSLKAILLRENVKITKYKLACALCWEDLIHELFGELNLKDVKSPDHAEVMILDRHSPFIRFWSRALLGELGKLSDGAQLPQKIYNQGFKLGILFRNDVAIRYFMSKACIEQVRRFLWSAIYHVVTDVSPISVITPSHHNITPAIFCLLFSKVSTEEKTELIGRFSYVLLKSLLNWPYQHLFEETLISVSRVLCEKHYWDIMQTLIDKIANYKCDFNYHRLFWRFWVEGSNHGYYSDSEYYRHFDAIYNVLKTKDRILINLMLTSMSTDDKDKLFTISRFNNNKIWSRLIKEKEFWLLELYIRGCSTHSTDSLVKFKPDFIALKPGWHDDNEWISVFGQEWEDGMKKFDEIVDKVIADQMKQSSCNPTTKD